MSRSAPCRSATSKRGPVSAVLSRRSARMRMQAWSGNACTGRRRAGPGQGRRADARPSLATCWPPMPSATAGRRSRSSALCTIRPCWPGWSWSSLLAPLPLRRPEGRDRGGGDIRHCRCHPGHDPLTPPTDWSHAIGPCISRWAHSPEGRPWSWQGMGDEHPAFRHDCARQGDATGAGGKVGRGFAGSLPPAILRTCRSGSRRRLPVLSRRCAGRRTPRPTDSPPPASHGA